MIEAHDYREFLKSELHRRQDKNPSYSLRAFARDLAISPSKLSGLLSGTSGLSAKAALSIALHLRLSELDQRIFVALAESLHARSKQRRQFAWEMVGQLRALESAAVLPRIYDKQDFWRYWRAVLTAELHAFDRDDHHNAALIGVDPSIVSRIYDYLVQNSWIRMDGPSTVKPGTAAEAQRWGNHFWPQENISSFNVLRNLLMHAVEAVETRPEACGVPLLGAISVPSDSISEFQAMADEFVDKLVTRFGGAKSEVGDLKIVSMITFPVFPTEG